jgi:tetratricopeptide (TPR) repeat protein
VAYYEELIATNTGDVRDARIAMARHLVGSGDEPRALALRRALAEEAMRSQEYAVAQQQLEEAIALAEGLGARVEVTRMQLSLARCWDALGRRREAIDLATRLDRQKDLPELLALEIRIERGRLWLDEEDPLMVEQVIKKAVSALSTGAREREGDQAWFIMSLRASGLQAEVLERQGKLVQAAQVLLQVIEETESRGVDARHNAWGPSLVWEPLNQLGRVRLKLGSAQGATQLFELALQVARDADDPRGEMRARGNLSAMCTQQGRLDAAQKHLTRALSLARQTGELRDQAKLEHNRGLLLRRQRRVEPARQAFEESMRLSRDLNWREGIALNAGQLEELEMVSSKLHEWES